MVRIAGMPPKCQQLPLSFKPRASLPVVRGEGAEVATSSSRIEVAAEPQTEVIQELVTGVCKGVFVCLKNHNGCVFFSARMQTLLVTCIPKAKKRRRELPIGTRLEVLKFSKTHSNAETLRQFPEVSASTLTRIKRNETAICKAAEKGKHKEKRVKNHLRKYQALGEAFHKFFLCVRDAHGGVSRNLLEAYALTLPEDIVKDFNQVNKSSKDIFWQRWRRLHSVVYRRVSGIKQYVPGDFEKRVEDYKSLLRSMHKEREYREFICGDETGVRMEEIGGTTLETQGTKHVHIASSGGEKTLFTIFLASRLSIDGNGNIQAIKKEPPLILFKGAEKGKIQKEIAKAVQDAEFQCSVATTPNGWQTGETFLTWLKDHIRAKKKTLLIVDLYAAHRCSQARTWLKDAGVDILYIPGGCTNILQVISPPPIVASLLNSLKGNGRLRECNLQKRYPKPIHAMESRRDPSRAVRLETKPRERH